MVHSCCAYKCYNRSSKETKVSFHSFPSRTSDKERFDAWVRAVNRQTESGRLWLPSEKGHDKICSEHFLPSDYKGDTNIRSLKITAVPSIFPQHPQHLQKATTSRPLPRKRKLSPSPSSSTSQLPRECQVQNDHSYAFFSGEDQMQLVKDRIAALEKSLEESRKENKNLKEKLKRRETKCLSIMEKLKAEKVISREQANILASNFGEETMALIENELKSKNTTPSTHRYSDAVKSFAVTVNFYSSQAYNYLRKFLHLPSSSTIRRWASTINCEPGFLSDVIDKLGENLQNDEDMRDIIIVFDSLAIKKEYVYEIKSKSFVGAVDFGNFNQNNNSELATEALFFMAVGLKGHWKQPFGYFLGKPNGENQAQLVKHAVSFLSEKGFLVHGVTCDGCFTNQSTAQVLGCSLDPDNIRPYFPHPEDEKEDIYFLFDACHLIKCVRNCIGDLKVIMHDNREIKWCYIESLNAVEQKDDLHLANKLKAKHIHYQKAKMNVKLAAQTLSQSVADAIDFLREDVKLQEFQGSEATTDFIKKIDTLFDLCNSRSPVAKGTKSKINRENLQEKIAAFRFLSSYITELTDTSGERLVSSRRKTPFIGFVATSMSLCRICERLLTRTHQPFKYVLTFKTSQDHLELLFSRLRRRGGWNNNPNVLQLKWALRSLLQRNWIQASSRANCIDLTVNDAASPTLFEAQPESSSQPKQITSYAKLLASSSIFHDSALYYIAGYICRKMVQRSKCGKCCSSLYTLARDLPDIENKVTAGLVNHKNRGGLLASNDLFMIVKTTDLFMKRMQLAEKDPLAAQNKAFTLRLQSAFIAEVRSKVFSEIESHFTESHYFPDSEDHGVQIIKAIVDIYTKMLMKHHAGVINERFVQENKPSLRHHLNKTILFLHQ